MARPTKLTPELQVKICALIAAGNWATTACKAAGVSTSTYYEWRARGEREESGPYADFLAAVEAADAEAECNAVALVQTGMESDPKLVMTFLERRFGKQWGRHPEPEKKAAKDIEAMSIRVTVDDQGKRTLTYDEPKLEDDDSAAASDPAAEAETTVPEPIALAPPPIAVAPLPPLMPPTPEALEG